MTASVLTKPAAAPTKPPTPNPTPIKKGIAAMVAIDSKAETAKMDRMYGKGKLVAIAAAWKIATGKKLTTLSKAGSADYEALSNLNRVIDRFGAVKPARISSWTTILKAVTLTDVQLDAIKGDALTQEMVIKAGKPATPATPARGSKPAKGSKLVSQTLAAGDAEAPTDWNSHAAQSHLAGLLNEFHIAMLDPRCSVHPESAASLRAAIKLVGADIK